MKSRFFSVQGYSLRVDTILLVLRLVCGYAFVLHGMGKIQNPFHWMGPQSSMPAVLQALAALSEFGGGMALIAGFLTPIAALGIGSTMTVAVYMHRIVFGHPFVSQAGGGSYELALVYLSLASLLFVAGPGRFSVDRFAFGTRP